MKPFEWFIFLPSNIFWPHFNSPLARNFDFDNTRIDTRQPQTDEKQTGWWKTLAKSYKTFVFTSVLSFDVVVFFAYGRFARQHFPQRNAIRKSQKHDELSKNKLENFTSEIYELRIRNQINEAHVFLGPRRSGLCVSFSVFVCVTRGNKNMEGKVHVHQPYSI